LRSKDRRGNRLATHDLFRYKLILLLKVNISDASSETGGRAMKVSFFGRKGRLQEKKKPSRIRGSSAILKAKRKGIRLQGEKSAARELGDKRGFTKERTDEKDRMA